MLSRRVNILFLAALLISACGPSEDEEEIEFDRSSFGNEIKSAQFAISLAAENEPRSTRRFRLSGRGAFKVSFRQDADSNGAAQLTLKHDADLLAESPISAAPELAYTPAETEVMKYNVTIANRSASAITGTLTIEPVGAAPSGDKLQYKSYRVIFTNPVCKTYPYSSPVPKAGGEGTLSAKPQNVYCKMEDGYGPTADEPPAWANALRALLDWLKPLKAGDEVFMAYLSFSQRMVANELCNAIKRGVKVTFILDAPSDRSQQLQACGGTIITRGHTGGIGYAHNKIVLINPNGNDEYLKLATGSANMTSGIILHHENWHFLEVRRQSYFAQSHLCLMKAQLSDTDSASIEAYRSATNACRAAIPYKKETDISLFFVPNPDDGRASVALAVDYIKNAKRISIGAHRFGNPDFVNALQSRLLQASDPVDVRMVADDDLYWVKPLVGEPQAGGDNEGWEADYVSQLFEAGGKGQRFRIKYMETNHGLHLLHHNKFMIFEGVAGKPDAVLYGAANLTDTGYYSGEYSSVPPNFENNYFSNIPEVVKAFKDQYARFWDGQKASPEEQEPPRATAPEDMPATNILP